jgi:hemoglobin
MRSRLLAVFCVTLGLSASVVLADGQPIPKKDSDKLPPGAKLGGGIDDKPIPRNEIDKWAANTVHQAAKYGTELFNGGNYEGCFRIYQATLVAVWPLLDHRPKLVALVQDHLNKAWQLKPADAAAVLREALDAVQKETEVALIPPKKPLWDRLGGEKAVKVVVHDFVVAAIKDPKINFLRDGKYKLDDKGVAKLEQSLVEYMSSVTGGPLKYSGRDMKEAHKGMKITDAEFQALVDLFTQTLLKHKIPSGEVLELGVLVVTTKNDIVGQ